MFYTTDGDAVTLAVRMEIASTGQSIEWNGIKSTGLPLPSPAASPCRPFVRLLLIAVLKNIFKASAG